MIEVKNIARSYGKRQVLKDVSLTAKPKEQVAIIGRNGCGKSTLLQVLAGIEKPLKGEISIFSQNALKNNKVFRDFVGYLPQENPLIDELSVKDNINMWSGRFGKPEKWLVDEFALEDMLNKKVATLSGGMKRRTAIACSLVLRPPILIMDEPTAALDIYFKQEIREFCKTFRENNGIIIMATHDELEIEESSKVYVMENGVLTLLRDDNE
ncbi:ABC transporter ATP-binding protein [Butyrivibrio sp. NC3005]|uniref:ABC transporter ATP-binding protein n=1 Tax=Butyrivibrio sp. NC3005 TaxID=1280685 RepID=UPI0003F93FAF|nr:ATP-binding cassette domain-containing protein [Butyrivibrio sp. NC3005]